MILVITAIKDNKAEIWHPPMFTRSAAITERWFANELLTHASDISKTPQDYDLYYLREFNDETAELTINDTQKVIAQGLQLKQRLLKEAGAN